MSLLIYNCIYNIFSIYFIMEINKINKECIICLEEINENNIFFNSCNHYNNFHKDCIYDWIKINPDCPICQNKIIILNHNDNLLYRNNIINIYNNFLSIFCIGSILVGFIYFGYKYY
jgi:hypothetical protein